VDTTSLSLEAQAKDRELQSLVQRVEDRVGQVMRQVARDPKAIRAGRYTVGDVAVPIATRTGCDGVLLLDSQSVIPSKGTTALAVILGGQYYVPTVTQAVAVLVEARSGRLHAVMAGAATGPVLKKPDVVARNVVASTFTGYPRRDEVRKAKAPKRGAAVEEEPAASPQDLEEEKVLADFEAIYAQRGGGTSGEEATEPAPPESSESAEAPVAEPTPPVEDIDGGNGDFQADGGAPEGTISRLEPPERPAEAEPPPPTTDAAAAPPVETPSQAPPSAPSLPPGSAVAPPAGEVASIRAMFAVPAAERSEPTLAVTLQGGLGGPAVVVRNASPSAVRVSIGFTAWEEVAPGAELRREVSPGSPWVLVSDASGRELARASCVVGADRTVTLELVPR
jgi:hypothetical protein